MIAKYLWIAGSLPFIILGSIHLIYTFFSNKFSSRNEILDEEMKNSSPILTKQTTMWKAWIGFNGSHSSGAIYFGVINLVLAIKYFDIIQSPVFLSLNIVTVLFYLWLAKKYWFSTPFTGISISALCYIASSVLIFLN